MFKVLEFTYPPGSHHIPRREWATRATLNLTDLPSSFSICSSVFVKSWVLTATDCYVKFFAILTEDGKSWSYLRVGPDLSGTGRVFKPFYGRSQGRVRIVTNATPPNFFPRSWVRACVTVDAAAGAVKIVAASLVTQEDWRWLAKELEPITNKIYSLNAPNTLQDLLLWLAATEGNSGEALSIV